jgi:hypothetical protein
MTDETSERETIYIMADFGMVPYAWHHGNIADSITGFPPEFGVSKELEAEFAEWVGNFERNYDKHGFDWEAFHQRGIELSRKLRKQIGHQFNIEYHKCIEDPKYVDDWERWRKESIIPIED